MRLGSLADGTMTSARRQKIASAAPTGSPVRPIFSATYCSTRGSILAKVPTAPEIAQVATSSRAATRRRRLRSVSGMSVLT